MNNNVDVDAIRARLTAIQNVARPEKPPKTAHEWEVFKFHAPTDIRALLDENARLRDAHDALAEIVQYEDWILDALNTHNAHAGDTGLAIPEQPVKDALAKARRALGIEEARNELLTENARLRDALTAIVPYEEPIKSALALASGQMQDLGYDPKELGRAAIAFADLIAEARMVKKEG